jgi:hypothetical protein
MPAKVQLLNIPAMVHTGGVRLHYVPIQAKMDLFIIYPQNESKQGKYFEYLCDLKRKQ